MSKPIQIKRRPLRSATAGEKPPSDRAPSQQNRIPRATSSISPPIPKPLSGSAKALPKPAPGVQLPRNRSAGFAEPGFSNRSERAARFQSDRPDIRGRGPKPKLKFTPSPFRPEFGGGKELTIRRAPEIVSSPIVRFPAAWSWFFDESVTQWVKTNYSPRDSWKNKPFSKEDSRFFFRGVEELSEIFTDDRSRGIPAYFNHSKFRSSYLLYFFPLQAAKFITVFQLHPKAFDAALAHGRKEGELRIADLGAGPGTASVAALLQLLQLATASGEELPKIKLLWVDTNLSVMKDGKKLAEDLISHFSRLRGKVEIELKVGPWWKASSLLDKPSSLTLLGHVLNESAGPDSAKMGQSRKRFRGNQATRMELDEASENSGAGSHSFHHSSQSAHQRAERFAPREIIRPPVQREPSPGDHPSDFSTANEENLDLENELGEDLPADYHDTDLPELEGPETSWGSHWKKLLDKAAGGGTLIVEPASKQTSQVLSQLRDQFLARGLIASDPSSIWGPCLHAGRCPLAEGRDWCHFSVPAHVPGNWFAEFSRGLGSERQWLKFSYLWIAAQKNADPKAAIAPTQPDTYRRVVSDTLSERDGSGTTTMLTCEPDQPGRLTVSKMTPIKRGDLIKLR